MLQYYFHGGANQQFKFSPMPDGSFKIIPQHTSGKVLDIYGASSANKANLVLYQSHDAANQRFKFVRSGLNDFKIFTGSSNYTKLVAVDSNATAGMRVYQYEDTGFNTTKWVFDCVGMGSNLSVGTSIKTQISGTTNHEFYFKRYGLFYIETYGKVNTYMELYIDTGSGYVFDSSNDNGGIDNNARLMIFNMDDYRFKIIVRGASASDSGTSCVNVRTF